MISGHSLRPCILAAFATIILASLAWGSTENVLYTFQGEADGGRPYGLPTFDATGNLYGTASGGGAYGHGVVFELTNNAGVWNYSVLYSFRGADSLSGPDGDAPMGPVTFDRAGNIYGTTSAGGSYRCGTVYELSLVDGLWVESVLHSFTGNGKDGCGPVSGVVLDAAGNIYGTAMWGGTTGGVCGSDGCGAVFKLKAVPGKPGKMVVLHTFKGGNDGG